MPNPTLKLDAELLAHSMNLELLARSLVEGYVHGLHRSPFRGSSQEFNAYRAFLPGDPLKLVDWKVYGRTDQLFVREFEEETNLRGYLFLDASRSMDYGDPASHKFAYARVLAAVLATIMSLQKDAPGLAILGLEDRISTENWLPPSTRRDHLEHLIHHLERTRPCGPRDDLGSFTEVLEDCFNRSISILISDGLFPMDQARDFLNQLRLRNHDTLLFHLLAPSEINPVFDDNIILVDSETGREVPVDGPALRATHSRRLERLFADLEQLCQSTETDYCRIITDEPLDAALRRYLALRHA